VGHWLDWFLAKDAKNAKDAKKGKKSYLSAEDAEDAELSQLLSPSPNSKVIQSKITSD